MMWVRLVLGLAVALVAGTAQADCADPFRDPDDIVDFQLRVTNQVWTEFRNSVLLEPSGEPSPVDPGPDSDEPRPSCDAQFPYFDAEFRCGDEAEWLRVGFRRKRDRTGTLEKLPIKLDFNRFVDGQRWPAARGELGFRQLTLNSGQPDEFVNTDPGPEEEPDTRPPGILSAALTEHLAWRIMRQELPEASGAAYARLTVQFTDTGEERYQGLYLLLEDIDRTAVRARFGVDEGVLYKVTDANCSPGPVFEDPPPNSATDAFNEWILESPAASSGAWYARTNQVMHLDALLRQEALRELLANTEDTILGRMNNFYSLDLQGRRRVYLPWDLDDMFRPQPQAREVNTPFVSSCLGSEGTCAEIPLGINIRDNTEVRPTYLQVMCRLSNGVADETRLVAQLESIDALIRPVIAEEVSSLWLPQGTDPLDASVPGTYASEVERMKTWIPGRIAAVRGLIEAEGIACPRGCTNGETATCEHYGCPSQRTCSEGLWGPCLAPSAAVINGEDADCDGVSDVPPDVPVGSPGGAGGASGGMTGGSPMNPGVPEGNAGNPAVVMPETPMSSGGVASPGTAGSVASAGGSPPASTGTTAAPTSAGGAEPGAASNPVASSTATAGGGCAVPGMRAPRDVGWLAVIGLLLGLRRRQGLPKFR